MAVKQINPANHKRFNQFLRDNNAASKYYVNRAKQARKNVEITPMPEEARDLVMRGNFIWSQTPEYANFWEDLDFKWCRICGQENIRRFKGRNRVIKTT